jgi:hypothetical protein
MDLPERFMALYTFLSGKKRVTRQQLQNFVQDKNKLEELLVISRGVYAPYMQNAIDYIKDNYGDIPGYAKAELGLTDEDILKLQTLYTK